MLFENQGLGRAARCRSAPFPTGVNLQALCALTWATEAPSVPPLDAQWPELSGLRWGGRGPVPAVSGSPAGVASEAQARGPPTRWMAGRRCAGAGGPGPGRSLRGGGGGGGGGVSRAAYTRASQGSLAEIHCACSTGRGSRELAAASSISPSQQRTGEFLCPF